MSEEHPSYPNFTFFTPDKRFAEVWEELREEVVSEWISETPGTRPPLWWSFDAPRWADPWEKWFYHGTFAEPRKRLGGIGTPAHEALSQVPAYTRGIPAQWVSAWQVAYFNGCAVDVHGTPIGTDYTEGHFPHKGIDLKDPPVFESEAAYLDRLGLLTDGERAHFDAHGWPEPEVVTPPAE